MSKPNTPVSEVENIQVYQVVNVRALLLLGANKPEIIPSNQNLTKLEGYLVDEYRSAAITIWNDDIKLVKDNQLVLYLH